MCPVLRSKYKTMEEKHGKNGKQRIAVIWERTIIGLRLQPNVIHQYDSTDAEAADFFAKLNDTHRRIILQKWTNEPKQTNRTKKEEKKQSWEKQNRREKNTKYLSENQTQNWETWFR